MASFKSLLACYAFSPFATGRSVCNGSDDLVGVHAVVAYRNLQHSGLTRANHASILPFVTDSSIANLPIPIVTLTTDFGLDDWYVAAMKAVLLSHSPAARLVDVTHTIPPGDVIKGSITLERAIAAFPPTTIHLAVIDPAVGSDRRPLIVRIHQQLIVCPDNGLVTWAERRWGGSEAFEIIWKPPTQSSTFHGRDLFAPVAGMLASYRALLDLAKPIPNAILLDLHPATGHSGQIIHIDHFGNATSNIPTSSVPPGARIRIANLTLPLNRTYSDVASGQPLALIGSSDLLEIAMRDGSAADLLQLKIGSPISLAPDGAKDDSHGRKPVVDATPRQAP
jgi:S-adenosylmethionine hydrolase